MGTRADFYIGDEWLGSIAWDGYEYFEFPECPIMQAKTADEFRKAVTLSFVGRDDVSTPETGWPWPWKTSATTDYAYRFEGDKVVVYCFGEIYEIDEHGETIETGNYGDWPDMSDKQKVTLGKRSGVIVFGVRHAKDL